MLSKNELKYAKKPFIYNIDYSYVLKHRITKKIDGLLEEIHEIFDSDYPDMKVIFQLKSVKDIIEMELKQKYPHLLEK
jgi:hypothetical protein